IPGQGGVTATGSAPAALRIPAHRFVEDAMAAVPLNGIELVQIATSIGIDAPYAAATVAPGGGPGSFTWCPGDPACVAAGGMPSTHPPHRAGPRHGRGVYPAGANRLRRRKQPRPPPRRGDRLLVHAPPLPPRCP